MVITGRVVFSRKQVLAGIENISTLQEPIQVSVSRYSLMAFSGTQISGSMDFYLGNNKRLCCVAYDITDYINFDRDNVLVVRADATQYKDGFMKVLASIRHVWLNQYNNLHIAMMRICFF